MRRISGKVKIHRSIRQKTGSCDFMQNIARTGQNILNAFQQGKIPSRQRKRIAIPDNPAFRCLCARQQGTVFSVPDDRPRFIRVIQKINDLFPHFIYAAFDHHGKFRFGKRYAGFFAEKTQQIFEYGAVEIAACVSGGSFAEMIVCDRSISAPVGMLIGSQGLGGIRP